MNIRKYHLLAPILMIFTVTLAEAQDAPAAPPTTHVLVTLTLKPEARQQPEIRPSCDNRSLAVIPRIARL